jgi:hypothetical protein
VSVSSVSGNLTILVSPIQGLFPKGFGFLLERAFVLPVPLFQAIEAFADRPRAVRLVSVSVTFSVSTSVSTSSSGLLPGMGFVGATFSDEGMSFGDGASSIWI